MIFYVGLHQPGDARHFDRACISINRLRTRRKPLGACQVLLDSGAFTELLLHGHYRHSSVDYAQAIARVQGVGNIVAAVAQDYMCEPFMLGRTGLTVAEHQRLTIERYDELKKLTSIPILPVLQGYQPGDYVSHLDQYGSRLEPGMWVGVGSVCKRNGKPQSVVNVLNRILDRRPDLRLHGFGLKRTAIEHPTIHALLWSADSMAWSYAARREGRNSNDWREAKTYEGRIHAIKQDEWQTEMAL